MARSSINICLDRTDEDLCDLEIIAGNGEDDGETGAASPILATKVFLYRISDKWKQLIKSAHKTLTADAEFFIYKIFIPQIQRDIMENIINFVYAGLRNEVQPLPLDDQNVGKYFAAAQFLEMKTIEEKCLSYFDSKRVTLENFSVLFKWWSTFGIGAIQPKMRTFLTQHSQQIPEIIRRCKNELNFPESEVAHILVDWLSFCSSEGENCDLDVKKVIRQFSHKNEKIKLLDAFFEAGDADWSKTAFKLLRNLCKNGDSGSGSEDIENEEKGARKSATDSTSAQHQAQNASATEEESPQSNKKDSRGSVKLVIKKSQFKSAVRKSATGTITPKSKSAASSFSSIPSKASSSKSGPTSNSNTNSSGCQSTPTSTPTPTATTSKSSAPPTKKRRLENNSTRLSRNSPPVELEPLDSPEQQKEQDEQPQIQNESKRESSASPSSSSNSSSNAPETQRKRTVDKNNKLTQNSSPKGIVYFLLKNQKSPGGFYFWSFNLKTHKTGQGAQLPPSFRDRQKLAMVYWKNTVYFMGGESSRTGKMTEEVYAFDLKSRQWTKVDMIDPRCDFGACVLNGNIYAVGGCEESPCGVKSPGVGINTVEMLSLASRKRSAGDQMKWEEVDFMESCRAHAGIVALEGKLYAIGGEVWNQNAGEVMSASKLCEVFDPKIRQPQDQWNPITPMKYKRLGLAAVTTTEPHPNRIYALGGTLKNPYAKTSTNSQALDIVEIYNPDEDSWKTGPPMKKPRKLFSAVYANNCIYALGGDSETQPTMEKFDLSTKKWTLEGDLKKEGNFDTVAFESL